MIKSKLVFGENIFDEKEIHKMLSKLSQKWVIHAKAEGLLNNPEKEVEFVEWYADKISDYSLINGLINSDSKELYILFDSGEEVEDAYEDWFPNQNYLYENESFLFVKFIAISPDGKTYFTNESPTEES